MSYFISKPSLENAVSQVCTASQFRESHYLRLCKSISQEPKFHRKQWEYVYILRVLEQCGYLKPGYTGIGFGCGKEPLAAVMAKEGVKVTVTDIPPLADGDPYWGSNQVLDSYYPGICSENEYLKHVSFLPVDMNNIPANLKFHDFLWSCCAFEHLGSLRKGLDFVLNSLKCLKPGGVAIHTTELNVSDDDETFESPGLSLYRRKDFIHFFDCLIDEGFLILPFNFYTGNLPEDKHIDLPPYPQEVHLKLRIEKYDVTSFGFAIQKKPENQ